MITTYKQKDYPIIALWYTKRGLTPPPKSLLPSLGFIADNRVAGWIYTTPTNIALIDGLISNPDCVPSLRRESLVRLCGTLVDTCLALGYTNVIALTKHPSVQQMCKKLGFTHSDMKVWILKDNDLSDPLE